MNLPQHDMASLEREFLAYAVAQAHPMVREWRGAKLDADLREATADVLDIVTDDAEKGRLVAAAGVRCIAHIDFPDSPGDFPFVEIGAASVPPGSIADLGPFAAAVVGAFGEFRPRAVYFFHPSHLPLRAPARVDAHLLAAPARSMAERPDAPGLARVELRRATDLDFYPKYAAAYAQVLDERPYLRGELSVESREEFAEWMEEGLVLEVFVDGAWAGLIAALPDLLAGIRGLQVEEIVLTKGARGQRLGPAVHQRFARFVAATDPAAILMGSISEKNAPSLRTSLRAGRFEVGAFCWVDS
jgi:hypothetical protein